MRTVTSITLPVVTFATLLAVVACGPSKDHVTVKTGDETPFSKAVESCEGTLKSSQKHVQQQSVVLCRISDEAAQDRTKESKPELVQHQYFYEVSKSDDRSKRQSRVQVKFKVGVSLPSTLSEKAEDAILLQLKDEKDGVCGRELSAFYQRSVRRLPVEIKASYFIVSDSPSATIDDYNSLDLKLTGGEAGYPIFEMSSFVEGAKFYPSGDPVEKKRCDSISGTESEKRKCWSDSFVRSNAKFCRQLVKMTGVWLGLTNEDSERKACGVSEAVTVKKAEAEAVATKEPANPTRSNKSEFMKSASEQDPTEFLKTAALSKEDLATVLSDSCTGLAKMIAPAATPTPAPSPVKAVTKHP